MISEQELLDEYKKYDYLNEDDKRPLVKILVSYVKPSFLFKSEILTPIQLGRAVENAPSKDGIQSSENLKWLHEHCEFHDDFEGGISEHNRRIGFLTGTYWAWKNYDKLGNPQYFGSFGYRRFFKTDFLEKLNNYDCIIPCRVDFSKTGPTIKDHILKLQGQNTLNIIVDVLNKMHPEDKHKFRYYLKSQSAYIYEIYVMKRDLFFEFCEWIFPLLFELLKISPEKYKFKDDNSLEAKFVEESGEVRDIAYVIEILTGFYCHKLDICDNLVSKQQSMSYILSNDSNSNKTKLVMKLLREKLKKL